MRVKDLLKQLLECDPDAIVVVPGGEGSVKESAEIESGYTYQYIKRAVYGYGVTNFCFIKGDEKTLDSIKIHNQPYKSVLIK